MKKVFVSCPMNGANKEEIMKRIHILHRLAELHFGEELSPINSWIEEDPTYNCKNPRLWYAGKSLELMSKADYYVGVNLCTSDKYKKYFGCHMENEAATILDIPRLFFNVGVVVPKRRDKNES